MHAVRVTVRKFGCGGAANGGGGAAWNGDCWSHGGARNSGLLLRRRSGLRRFPSNETNGSFVLLFFLWSSINLARYFICSLHSHDTVHLMKRFLIWFDFRPTILLVFPYCLLMSMNRYHVLWRCLWGRSGYSLHFNSITLLKYRIW